MSLVLLISIVIKAVGALLEIVNQALITRTVGVAAYGEYAYYLNILEIVFWVMFSAIVKCNTFYLSDKGVSIRSYKKKYYLFYVLPVAVIGILVSLVMRKVPFTLIFVLLIFYILSFDQSSTLMARGHYYTALTGEYVLGRVVNLGGILILLLTSRMSLLSLLFVYGVQYVSVVLYFVFVHRRKMASAPLLQPISISTQKATRFQISDMTAGAVDKAPVILQYLFVSSFEAGFVSIVVLVKRLVNFVTGPTAKVFMPEFSRLYKANDKEGIRRFYVLIMRIQMLFISLLSVPMLAFSVTTLTIFSKDLADYSQIFRIVALIFLAQATLGPSTSLMQMTGQEKKDNIIKIVSIAAMILTWVIMRANPLFTLYGLCVQAIVEALTKFTFASLWFRKLPVHPLRYALMWFPVITVWLFVFLLNIRDSILPLILAEIVMCVVTAATLMLDKNTRTIVLSKLKRKRTPKD